MIDTLNVRPRSCGGSCPIRAQAAYLPIAVLRPSLMLIFLLLVYRRNDDRREHDASRACLDSRRLDHDSRNPSPDQARPSRSADFGRRHIVYCPCISCHTAIVLSLHHLLRPSPLRTKTSPSYQLLISLLVYPLWILCTSSTLCFGRTWRHDTCFPPSQRSARTSVIRSRLLYLSYFVLLIHSTLESNHFEFLLDSCASDVLRSQQYLLGVSSTIVTRRGTPFPTKHLLPRCA